MRITAPAHAAVFVAGILVACTPRARAGSGSIDTGSVPDTSARIRSDTVSQLRGTLFITGSEPATTLTLQLADGTGVALVGDVTDELRRLSGATVVVYGSRTTRAARESFAVQRYDIRSIDGQTPFVGTLHVHDGGVWLVAADSLPLATVPDSLRAQSGAKVWITGRRTDRGLEVQSYGVLRPPR